jgi:hypothetical protein
MLTNIQLRSWVVQNTDEQHTGCVHVFLIEHAVYQQTIVATLEAGTGTAHVVLQDDFT